MILIYAKRFVYLLYMIIIYQQVYVMSNALVFVYSFVFCPSCSFSNSFDFHNLFISKHNYLLRSCLKFNFYLYDVYCLLVNWTKASPKICRLISMLTVMIIDFGHLIGFAHDQCSLTHWCYGIGSSSADTTVLFQS